MSAARRRECDSAVVQGRARKAQQFWDAAQLVREFAEDDADISDVFVTLCVHAAIAAADVICCAALGEHAQGDNHSEAVNLLSSVDRAAGKGCSHLTDTEHAGPTSCRTPIARGGAGALSHVGRADTTGLASPRPRFCISTSGRRIYFCA